jgi:hypothetical protein
MNKENDILEYFHLQISECAEYFNNWLYPKENIDEDDKPFEKSVFCKIYDAFADFNSQKGLSDTSHNCIGCNFEEGARTIDYFLQSNKGCSNIQYYLNLYSFLFYAEAERLAVIYKEIGYTNSKLDFDWERFPNLQLIKYWANFFKHPKAYMFLHHPDYHIDSDPNKPNFMITLVIDNDFVKRFYKAGAKNEELRELLVNKARVKIFFPDLIDTTKILCDEFDKIITALTTNEVIIEKLNDYTTIELESLGE